jgi:Holliday junction resolvase RusA-like endonuclease
MSDSITFTVHAIPKAKMRHQTVVTLRCGRCQRLSMGQRKVCQYCENTQLYFSHSNEYTPKEQKEAESFIALCAAQAMRGREKFTGPSRIECVFYFGIPKSREKKLKDNDWHTQRPDTDNCVKTLWDSVACGICMADDCVVVQMMAEKRWTTGVPRTVVTISSLAVEDATAEQEPVYVD